MTHGYDRFKLNENIMFRYKKYLKNGHEEVFATIC